MVVEFDEFLVVVDAPVSSENGELILKKIKEQNFGKPIKYFVFGHHHPHYLGGVRPFIHRGIIVLTPPRILPYLKQLAKFRYSKKPDQLHSHPKQLSWKLLEDSMTIADKNYSMKIFDIGYQSKHTDDYLLFYFPKEKMLFQDDGIRIRPGGPVSARTKGVYQAIIQRKLNVVDCIQSWPVRTENPAKFKFRDLSQIIDGKAKRSP